MPSFPNVGKANIAADLGYPFFESVPIAGGIDVSRLGLAEKRAKIEKVLLRRGALGEIGSTPLADEFKGGSFRQG